MFTKLTINNIVINETNGTTTTTMKIDSITFEDNCSVSEAIKVLEAAVEFSKKKNKRRYHVSSLMHNHFVHDVQNDKYYTISGNELRQISKEAYLRMLTRIKNNIREGYFDNGLKEYYSDTLPVPAAE